MHPTTPLVLSALLGLLSGATLPAIAQSPKPQEPVLWKAQKAAPGKPSGQWSADGRSYADPEAGFSLRLPVGVNGWVAQAGASDPGVLLEVRKPELDAFVRVGILELPEGGARAEVLPELLAKIGQSMGSGYRDLSGSFVERGGARAYELRSEIEKGGQRMLGISRWYVCGKGFLTAMALFPAEAQERAEKEAVEILDTFTPGPPESLLGPDGRTYTDAAHGFSLAIPGKGWSLSRRVEPGKVLELTNPEGTVIVLVDEREGDAPFPLEKVGPANGAALRGLGENVTVLHSQMVERPAPRHYEMELEMGSPGQRSRNLVRFYGRDTHLLSVAVIARWDCPEPQRKVALQLLDSFTPLPVEPDEAEAYLLADRRTYSNPEIGFSIHLPQAEEGWRWDPRRRKNPVAMVSGDGAVQLYVSVIPTHGATLVKLGELMERFLVGQPGSTRIRGGVVSRDGKLFYELVFELQSEGHKAHMVRRSQIRGDQELAVVAIGRPESWAAHEKAIEEGLVSLTLLSPPPASPAGPPLPFQQ